MDHLLSIASMESKRHPSLSIYIHFGLGTEIADLEIIWPINTKTSFVAMRIRRFSSQTLVTRGAGQVHMTII